MTKQEKRNAHGKNRTKQKVAAENSKVNIDYKRQIIEMVKEIENPHFLRQIWTILKKHIEREGV